MKQKIILFLVIILFLTSFVQARELSEDDYGIWKHEIEIIVKLSGTGEVTERFNLYFNSEEGKISFREKSLELGTDLKQWEELNEKFSPTLGQNNWYNGKISYIEGENKYLEIKYDLVGALMTKGKETNFMEEYSIKANYLNKLFQSGLWIIPDNTVISFELPPGAEINEEIVPGSKIINLGTKRVIVWEGYQSANQLRLKYVIWKKISPIIDLNDFTHYLFRTQDGLIIIGTLIIIIGLIIWKRKFFITRIETFVENNTVFEEDE